MRRPNRRWIPFAAVVVAATLAAGCSSAPPGDTAGGTSEPPATPPVETPAATTPPAPPWRSTGLAVHSTLAATDDSIVYAGVEAGEVVMVALDPEDGSERWRRPSAVGRRIPGVTLVPHTDRDTAYFLQRVAPPDESGAGGLVLTAVVTATGEQRWSTPIDGEPDPHISRCGDHLCLFTRTGREERRWIIAPDTGAVIDRVDVALPDGPGDDAFVGSRDDGATILTSTRNPVIIGQFSDAGRTRDWYVTGSKVFPGEAVSPNTGWSGWANEGDDGWVIWLGTRFARGQEPKPGDVVDRGAVAGVSGTGEPRWLRADLHTCYFGSSPVPVLCDGDSTLDADGTYISKPSMMTRLDDVTGETIWRLELGGVVDEVRSTDTVLQIDDDTLLVALLSGRVLVDFRTGPQPLTGPDPVGWCQPGTIEGDEITFDGKPRRYIRYGGHFPCRLGGEPAGEGAPSLPVPAFVGVRTAHHSAWVQDGVVHGQRNP